MRSIPFLFVTGHGEPGLKKSYPDAPLVRKPFRMDELRLALQRALARPAR
jgi:hypothetical protein